MSAKMAFLTLISQFLLNSMANRACVPYSHYLENGRICVCDNNGRFNDTNCHFIGQRRQMCPSGQIIWQGCNQCICQENGQLTCSSSICPEDVTSNNNGPSSDLRIEKPQAPEKPSNWCTPYKPYYTNCSICICPPSAQLSEAKCARDKYCKLEESSSLNLLVSGKNACIPNVMYLFPCLQCMCSEGGYFSLDKCVATCHSLHKTQESCATRTFFKKDCNVCWCPDDGIVDEKFCTQVVCNKTSNFRMLQIARRNTNKCVPHTFTKPKCFYCICSADGKINEKACLELECLKKYDSYKEYCQPGEMVPVCVQCLCLKNGQTNFDYCSKTCTDVSRLNLLGRVLNESLQNDNIIDRKNIKMNIVNDYCQPHTLYKKDKMYCLCPADGNSDTKLCIYEHQEELRTTPKTDDGQALKKCEPHTFVQVDCNTCYCSKNGTIDPRWCTYDDCESKRIIMKTQRFSVLAMSNPELSNTCTPGSILKQDCNFCICPNNGSSFGRVCTQNSCSDIDVKPISDELITCEPLMYYVVDCNTCLCPADGIKNVEKCSKNVCDKSYLRSRSCDPGQLFSEDCNVCICPPNGDRSDSVCTNHTCSEADAPWKRIFKISQNLLSNHLSDGARQLDVCFPGEEFAIGCKHCVCPDIGLKAYATCTPVQCDEEPNTRVKAKQPTDPELKPARRQELKEQEASNEQCVTYNMTLSSSERRECTPGAMYILRCRECICPYMGDISLFCRPLRKGIYCEQAFPGFNYAPMRRQSEENAALEVFDTKPPNHNHTAHPCYKPGKILDECFICECDDREMVVIEEHCFKSSAEKCKDAEPDFLKIDFKEGNSPYLCSFISSSILFLGKETRQNVPVIFSTIKTKVTNRGWLKPQLTTLNSLG